MVYRHSCNTIRLEIQCNRERVLPLTQRVALQLCLHTGVTDDVRIIEVLWSFKIQLLIISILHSSTVRYYNSTTVKIEIRE